MAVRAVQQIMLGSVCRNEAQALETLRAVKAAGYDGLELNGFMIRPTSFMVRMMTKAAGMPVGKGGNFDWKGMLQEAGLCVVGLHEDLGSIKRDPEAVLQKASELGTDKVVLTGMYRFDYSDRKAVAGLVKDLNVSGERLSRSGIALLYHNHNCEFRKVEKGRTAYDMIIEETDPRYVGFELDSYWPTEAGISAIALMRRLGERMRLYHINDRGTKVTGPSMTPILRSDSMELGYGNMDLKELAEQALSAKVDAVILESHKNWAEKSPIKSLQMSSAFMKEYIR